MSSGSIIILRPGMQFPKGLLDAQMKNYKTVMSFAAAKDGQVGAAVLLPSKYNWEEAIGKLLAKHPASSCVFSFGQYDKLPEDAYQPYTLIEKDKKKLAVAFLEGEFPDYNGKDDYDNAHRFYMDYLADRIAQIYKQNGDDLMKTMDTIDNKRFSNELMGDLQPRGSLVIVSAVKAPLLFSYGIMGANETGATIEHGWVTRTHGYKEKPVVTLPVAPDNTGKKATSEMSLEEKAAALMEGDDDDEPVVDTGKKASVPVTGQTFTFPRELNRTQLKDSLKRNLKKNNFPRNIPPELKWDVNSDAARTYPLTDFLPNAPILESLKKLPGLKNAIDNKAKETPDAVSSPALPLGTKTKETIINMINNKRLPTTIDPSQIQNLEEPYDSFCDQLQLDDDIVLFWGIQKYEMLGNESLMGLSRLTYQLARRVLELDPTIKAKVLEQVTAPAKKEEKKTDAADALMM